MSKTRANITNCLLFVILQIVPFISQSQSNFVDGIIVKYDGSKKSGQIDFRNWKINPLQIQFRSNNKIIDYGPKDLISFHIEEDTYYSAKVEKELLSLDGLWGPV